MRNDLRLFLRAQHKPHPRNPMHEWSAENIDFSLVPTYDTPTHAPFDPNFAPYMIPVMDWLQDYSTREIWIRKCSRACATEYVIAWMRWVVATAPCPMYYLTTDQLTAERFMESRYKRGFDSCPAANRYYKQARKTEHDIRFPHMDFRIGWPNAKGAFRQDGWKAIIADEFSTWKAFAAEALRKRAGTYSFHKIIGLSSPDHVGKHPDGDPVILEYEATDQCLWMMPDPKTGNPFAWEFGGAKKAHGLKWPDDCKDPDTDAWDLERVKREAYYVTPDGARIENSQRRMLNAQGQPIPQNENAPEHIHGLWINGPMIPFSDGDFGTLAYRFLEAKRRGHDALRSYFYENWADPGDMPDSTAAGAHSLKAREINYNRGEPFWNAKDKDGELIIIVPDNAKKGLFLTFDVQKYHLWWVARWWLIQGERVESGLEDYGNIANFDDAAELVQTANPSAIGVDIGYAERYGETADFCALTGALALKGEDNMKQDLYLRDDMNPNEGRKAGKRDISKFSMLTWNTDIFRTKQLAAIRGETPWVWHVPTMPGADYARQVLSTTKKDGVWGRLPGHPADHDFDCEVMQLVLARFDNLIQ